MPDVFQVYNSTVQPGVTVDNPTIADTIDAGPWTVDTVTIVIPAGHAGLTGVQLWYGGGPAIPYDSGWFSGDDDYIPLDLSEIFPPGVPWTVAMINNDVIPHSFQTRWAMSYLTGSSAPVPAAPVNVQDIYSAAAGAENTG